MFSQPRIRVMIAGTRLPATRDPEEVLARQQDMTLVGAVAELERIAHMAWKWVPNVLVLSQPGVPSAVEATRDVLAKLPEVRILVVIPTFTSLQGVEIIQEGACGVIGAAGFGTAGANAIRAIHKGEIWGSRTVMSQLVQMSVHHAARQRIVTKSMLDLTAREGEVVQLVKSGSTNKEIAAQLEISDKTVKTHLRSIFSKLNIRRRAKITLLP